MNSKTVPILILCLALSGCATMDKSILLGAGTMGAIGTGIGAVAALKTAYVVPSLPKTRSGKILRNLLRKIVNGEDYGIPPTIEDPAVPALIAAALLR